MGLSKPCCSRAPLLVDCHSTSPSPFCCLALSPSFLSCHFSSSHSLGSPCPCPCPWKDFASLPRPSSSSPPPPPPVSSSHSNQRGGRAYRGVDTAVMPLSLDTMHEKRTRFGIHASSAQIMQTAKIGNLNIVPAKEDNVLDLDPAYYEMGYIRHVRAYGIEFKEGPDGVGVYAVKDIPYLRKPRIIMEIPVELMISVSKYHPWIFYPNFVPFGHPMFEIINSTDPEVDWDLRLACLLLLAMDTKDHFWQLYSDFLPETSDSTSMIFATEGELAELQDDKLAQKIRRQQKRAESFWAKNWVEAAPLKIKRLARTSEQFKWAVAMAQTRNITMTMCVGARPQEANMFIPYVEMLNHSFQPTCSYRWRRKDKMLEVVVNRGQTIKAGTQMTLNYMEKAPNEKYLELYGFSSPANEWEKVKYSGNARIHLESFLSAFKIAGLPDQYYHEDAQGQDDFVDGYLIAAARSLPFWSEKDLPFLPSMERSAVKELQEESLAMLDAYPTTLEFDVDLLRSNPKRKSRRWRAAIEYRIHQKCLLKKITMALDLYLDRLLF